MQAREVSLIVVAGLREFAFMFTQALSRRFAQTNFIVHPGNNLEMLMASSNLDQTPLFEDVAYPGQHYR